MELGLGRTEIGFLKIWLWIPAALVGVAALIALPIVLDIVGLPYVSLIVVVLYITALITWFVYWYNYS